MVQDFALQQNQSVIYVSPKIAAFFRETERADKLSSGVRNIFKYVLLYSKGVEPQLIESNIIIFIAETIRKSSQKSIELVKITPTSLLQN